MNLELKARIDDPERTEADLTRLGAEFIGAATHRYIYFNQPPGEVLKLTEADDAVYRTVIRARGNQFEIVSHEPTDDPAALRIQLTRKYGIKRRLTNHRRFFTLPDNEVSINLIDGVGDFLIIEGAGAPVKLLGELGLGEAVVVTDSFDNL
jgi:adenylate cyclase class IV